MIGITDESRLRYELLDSISNSLERLALLEKAADNPRDDAPRLIYSDWLEECGFEDLALLIRFQIRNESSAIAVKQKHIRASLTPALRRLTRSRHYLEYDGLGMNGLANWCLAADSLMYLTFGSYLRNSLFTSCVIRRGFVDSIIIGQNQFLTNCKQISQNMTLANGILFDDISVTYTNPAIRTTCYVTRGFGCGEVRPKLFYNLPSYHNSGSDTVRFDSLNQAHSEIRLAALACGNNANN